MMHIFVEGETDETFISEIFDSIIKNVYGDYTIIKYQKSKKQKTINYINSINRMKRKNMNAEYLFIHDQDGNDNVVEDIIAKYPILDRENIFISVFEIESWIIAGISDNLTNKYKIKPPINTDSITKEKFRSIKPERLSLREFIIDVIAEYDVTRAMERSSSFCAFYEFFDKKKQAKDCF